MKIRENLSRASNPKTCNKPLGDTVSVDPTTLLENSQTTTSCLVRNKPESRKNVSASADRSSVDDDQFSARPPLPKNRGKIAKNRRTSRPTWDHSSIFVHRDTISTNSARATHPRRTRPAQRTTRTTPKNW